MATIDIGKLTFTHKGDYAGGTAYVANDVVYYNGSAYIAKTSTTGNLPTSTAHWNTFAAGSGGIWNAGLSLGTAGQIVQVNSGASALEFTDNLKPIKSVSAITSHNLNSTSICWSLIFLTEPVINAFMPKGVQSVKFGLTEGLVGGAIKAALSIALNCPEPIKLFETTVEICIPILLDPPSSPVKLAIAIGSGST